jgi:hypothetical protein
LKLVESAEEGMASGHKGGHVHAVSVDSELGQVWKLPADGAELRPIREQVALKVQVLAFGKGLAAVVASERNLMVMVKVEVIVGANVLVKEPESRKKSGKKKTKVGRGARGGSSN